MILIHYRHKMEGQPAPDRFKIKIAFNRNFAPFGHVKEIAGLWIVGQIFWPFSNSVNCRPYFVKDELSKDGAIAVAYVKLVFSGILLQPRYGLKNDLIAKHNGSVRQIVPVNKGTAIEPQKSKVRKPRDIRNVHANPLHKKH